MIDEAHQVLATVPKDKTLPVLQCAPLWDIIQRNFNWYVTGTPAPFGRLSIIAAMRFLQLKASCCENDPFHTWLLAEAPNEQMFPVQSLLFSTFKENLFWRNTKESVKDQIELSPVVEKLYFIEFTPIEKVLYASYIALQKPDRKLRQLCSWWPPVNEEEESNIMAARYIKKVAKAVREINQHREDLYDAKKGRSYLKNSYLEREIVYEEAVKEGPPPPDDLEATAEFMLLSRSYERARDEYFVVVKHCETAKIGMINNYAALDEMAVLSSATFVCELCKERIFYCEKTSCEHTLCTTCWDDHMQLSKESGGILTCPICSKKLSQATFKNFKTCGPRIFPNLTESVSNNSGFGSKLVAICGYLQNIMDSTDDVKLIVFSQYEETLASLTSILSKIDPQNFTNQIVACKGNIYSRRKAINAFNSTEIGSPRILLLSLANNASGTHLPVATHIVLVDPVVGTQENAKALDSQAIARAHRIGQNKTVVAVRFIVKGTIEQEDYENAYGQIQTSEQITFTLTERPTDYVPKIKTRRSVSPKTKAPNPLQSVP